MTSVSGLDESEAAAVATEFGVATEQVRRDHFISLVLGALTVHSDELIFFGGTALARTHLPLGRLSEDVDLIATDDRTATAERISRTIDRALLVTHGRLTWSPSLASARDTDPITVQTDDGVSVRVQLLRAQGYEPWPTERRDLYQRYSDTPPARLRVPTLESFVAWKTATWHDRAAPRDLYDLWALAKLGAMTPRAAELFAIHGPIGAPPPDWMFATAPTPEHWRNQLAGQTRLEITADAALTEVREAWRVATR
jgi:predicted nucleotidyltransferase component of viral defense system